MLTLYNAGDAGKEYGRSEWTSDQRLVWLKVTDKYLYTVDVVFNREQVMRLRDELTKWLGDNASAPTDALIEGSL